MSSARLVRSLTLIPAAAIALANIIGTGVFAKARVMTCNVRTPGMVLLVWFVAGLLPLVGSMVYAELSTMMLRARRRVQLHRGRVRPRCGAATTGGT